MDKFTHKENLSQLQETYNRRFKIAITFLNVHNGVFNITSKTSNITFMSVFENAEYNIIHKNPGPYELHFLKKGFKRVIIHEGYITI